MATWHTRYQRSTTTFGRLFTDTSSHIRTSLHVSCIGVIGEIAETRSESRDRYTDEIHTHYTRSLSSLGRHYPTLSLTHAKKYAKIKSDVSQLSGSFSRLEKYGEGHVM